MAYNGWYAIKPNKNKIKKNYIFPFMAMKNYTMNFSNLIKVF